jgi:hypothetical protein
MTIRVLADGADGYRLLSAEDAVVGWIRGRAIGVTGFASYDAVVSGAVRAYCVLASWLERQHLHPLTPLDDAPARCIHDGAYRWIVIGRVPIARLPSQSPSDDVAGAHSFEIVLKGALSEGMAIHAALVVLRAARGRIDAADIVWSSRHASFGAAPLVPTTHLDLEAG